MKATSLGIVLLFAGLEASAGPIIIGYSNTISVSSFTPSLMQQVGRLRWFFAHASVGENLLSGIASLHAQDPTFYALTRSWEGGAIAPTTTVPGTLYDFNRGNPGWWVKVDEFAGYVRNGWNYPLVDAVLNKFCFIDADADVESYISQTAALEEANPETWFIYATMPLRTEEDSDNYARNLFNNSLRAWVRANNRVLFDIADIEAHAPDGVPQTFVYNQQVCQKLYSGYTTDGGHLETTVAQETAAKGLYALGAALLNHDIPDMQLQAYGLSEGTFQLQFFAVSNVLYTVQCSSNPASGTWQTLARFSPQNASCTVLVLDSTASEPQRFYRVAAQLR